MYVPHFPLQHASYHISDFSPIIYLLITVNEESVFKKTQAFAESSSGLSSQKGQLSIPLAPEEENNTEPSFSFGSKSARSVKFSTDISSFNKSADLNSELNLGVSAPKRCVILLFILHILF